MLSGLGTTGSLHRLRPYPDPGASALSWTLLAPGIGSDLQIAPLSEPACCRLRSEAFERSLTIYGLSAGEMAAYFSADGARPEPHLIAARGSIGISVDQDESVIVNAIDLSRHRRERLSDGQALLSSGQPGQARLDAKAAVNRLLPGPLNLLLAQQWARQGLFPLHAAALRWRGRGLLILGDQGTGKSSLVLAALGRGGRVVSDDWLLVGDGEAEARAERLRRFLMFRSGSTWDRFGASLIETHGVHATGDGRFVHPIDRAHAAFPNWTPLDRCILLEPPAATRPDQTTLEIADQARALGALIDGAMPILMTRRFPVERALLFDRFQSLSRRLPVIAATMGQDLIAEPTAVLDRLSSG